MTSGLNGKLEETRVLKTAWPQQPRPDGTLRGQKAISAQSHSTGSCMERPVRRDNMSAVITPDETKILVLLAG